ncbi:MAG TPA: hypothetical protein VLH10_01835 [Yinghuangia sp.]|nr:hypothetical protein [Yinghuangia sp.]
MTSDIAMGVQLPPGNRDSRSAMPNPDSLEPEGLTTGYAALAASHNDEDEAAHRAMRTRAASSAD